VKGFAGTFYITWQKVLPAGMKKVCKDKAFIGLPLHPFCP